MTSEFAAHLQSTRDRLDRFVSSRLVPAIHRDRRALAVSRYRVPGEPVPFADAVAQDYEPVAVGQPWGRPWGTEWFRVAAEVPAGTLPAGDRWEVVVDLGFHSNRPGGQAEGLVYDASGRIVKAIEPRNNHIPLDDRTSFELFVEASAIPDILGPVADWQPTPWGSLRTAGDEPLYVLKQVDLAIRDQQVWELAQDIRTVSTLLATMTEASTRRARLLRALDDMLDAVDPAHVSRDAAAGRAALASVLAQPASATSHRIVAVGHAHLDSIWLWPARETVRKAARTFANVLRLMDEDDEFVFACSSAQQLTWIRDSYPDLFEGIRGRAKEGRFVPVGGMWVESDTNLPSGESLVRQFVAGKRFFLEEFGIDAQEVWLPDSFGYSAALPQIARLAGARWFLTQKISWNDTNRMPHHTFDWEGIDGTRIFTHFPPIDTYIAELTGDELHHAESNFSEKGEATTSLAPFGWGDGGGGPTREHLAAAQRTRSLEGSPRVEIGSPATFFTEAEAELPNPPVWKGELYLELHRGTYTTQARLKRGNRECERLLLEAELWATTAMVRTGAAYPHAELRAAWETVLLQQFHDALPGTSISWVVEEMEANYLSVAATLEGIIRDALAALSGSGDAELTVNASPFARQGVPAHAVGRAPTAETVDVVRQGDRYVLDNGILRAEIDAAGEIVSLRDAATGREAIAPSGSAGRIELFRDTPNKWDAWDIERFYARTPIEVGDDVEVSVAGAVTVTRTVGSSRITQTISLAFDATSLDIEVEVDWRERDRLLKLAFDLDVHAERFAAEIQFGHVERSSLENTSWDLARFESVAHRWIRVAEQDYGVSIANDATYGHDVRRHPRPGGGTSSTVRLSLLRAPMFPDPETDQGTHVFRVSVQPGASVASAVEQGYARNIPMRTFTGANEVPALASVSAAGVVLETVKAADDASGDVILRVYESRGARAVGEVVLGFAAVSATVVDLLERPLAETQEVVAGRIALELRPFEVRTLRITRSS